MSPIVNDGLSLGDEYFEGLEEKLAGSALPQTGPPEPPRKPEMHIDGGVTISDVQRRSLERVRQLAEQLKYSADADTSLAISRELRAEVAGLHPSQRRTDRDPQISAANTLIAILSEIQHIRNALEALNEGAALFSGGDERISSITIEDMVKGSPKITSKSYEGRGLTRELIDQHLDAHAYAHREAERRALDGWAETVAALEREGVGD